MKTPLTWRGRLAAHKAQSRVVPIPPRLQASVGVGTIAIPDAREVAAVVAQIPPHKLVTAKEISAKIAQQKGATIGCAVSTGILLPLVARAAHEAANDTGAPNNAAPPYWRALKVRGELNPNYPGGISNLKARLENEGHTIIQKRKRFFVQNYAEKLAD